MSFRFRVSTFVCGFAAVMGVFFAGSSVQAATYTWSNLGTDWNTVGNWGGTVPTPTDVGQFNSASYGFQPSIAAPSSIGGIWVTGAGAVTAGTTATGTLTINGATINGNASTGIEIDPGAGALTLNAPIVLGGSQTWINNAGNTMTVNGAITGGANALTINGNGQVTLTNGSTYTGGTTVNGGTLNLNYNNGDNGTPTIKGVLNINSGAVVKLNVADAVGYGDGCIPTINIVGGAIVANSINAYTTNFNLTGGTIASYGGNQYDFTNGFGITTLASTATSLISAPLDCRDGNNLRFNVASGTTASGIDLLVTGQLSAWGTGLITKTGAGLMVVANNGNNYGGTTTISGGTLQFGDGATTNGNVPGSVVNNATLAFANPNTQTMSYAISGSGNLVKIGAGALYLTSSSNSYSGTTTINGGGLDIGVSSLPNTTPNSILINFGGALDVSGPYTTLAGWLTSGLISTSSSGALAISGVDNETLNFSSSGYAGLGLGAVAGGATYSGSLTPTGTTYNLGGGGGALTYTPALSGAYGLAVGSSLILTSSASYTGPTTISSGTLQLANTASQTLSGNISGGGGLAWSGGATLTLTGSNSYTGSTTISSAGTLQFSSTANQTLTGPVGGNGNLVQAGPGALILAGNNTYTGSTTIGGGTLQIGNGTSGEYLASQSVAIASGGVLAFNQADTLTYTGIVSGSGSLVKNGTGLLNLNNNSTYTGGTAVNGGTLALNVGSPSGAIQGVLNINPGAMVNLTGGNGLGYSGGSQTYVTTVNIVGGVINIPSTSWEAYTTNFTLTGGTMSGSYGGANNPPFYPAYNFSSGYGITTYASTATSLISTCIYGRGGNVPFNVASGTAPGGIDLNVTGVVFDNGAGITKSGAGLMQLAGYNDIVGTTTISGGTLQLGDGVSTNSSLSSNVTDNAALAFANPYAETYGFTIGGSGNLVKSGAGTLILSGNNSYNGTTTINGGNLAMANLHNTAANSVVINSGGALVASGPYTNAAWVTSGVISSSSSGVLALVGADSETVSMGSYNGLVLGATPAGATYSGTLLPAGTTYRLGGGGGALTVSSPLGGGNNLVAFGGGSSGALYLTGNNTYSGSTTINGGLVAMSQLPNNTASSILINAGGALSVSGPYATIAGWLSSGLISQSSSGALALVGANSETVNLGSSYSGLSLGAAPGGATYSGSLTPANSTYQLGGGDGALTVSTALTGAKSLVAFGGGGSGTVILRGNSSYSGGTTINAQTLQFAQTVAMPSSGTVVVNPSATLAVNVGGGGEFTNATSGAGSVGGLLSGVGGQGGGVTWAAGSILGLDTTNAGGNFSYAGNIGGAIGLTKLGAGNLALSGNLSLSGPVAVNAGGLTLTGNDTYTGNTTISGGTLQIGGSSVALASPTIVNNGALVFNNSNSMNYGGVIIGSGGLTMNGTGQVLLSNASTYTGGTTVNSGTLAINYTSNNSRGAIVGVLNINPGATVNLANGDVLGYTVAGTYVTAVNINGGVLTTGNNQAYTTTFYLTGGTMSGNSNASYDFAGNNGITTLASTATSLVSVYLDDRDGWTMPFNVASGTTASGIDLAVTAAIRNSSGWGIVKNGTGVMMLSASNTYLGPTTISGGILQLGDGTANNGSVVANIVDNAALVFANPNPQTYGLATSNGTQTISGSGSLTMAGSSILTLVNSNTFTGVTKITAGTLALGTSLALEQSTLDTSGVGALSFGTLTTATLGGLQGTGNLVLANATSAGVALSVGNNNANTTMSGGLSDGGNGGSLTKVGSGNLVLAGVNTYSGTTTVSAGALTAATTAALPGFPSGPISVGSGAVLAVQPYTLSASNGWTSPNIGTLTSNSNAVFAPGSSLGIYVAGGDALTWNTDFAPLLPSGGSVGLAKVGGGLLMLTASNSFTTPTTISGGTLQLGDGTAHNGYVSGNITDNAALVFANITAQTYSGAISGNGSLTKNGTTRLALNSENTYTGGTTVNGGTLALNYAIGGPATIRGVVNINPGAVVTLNGPDAMGYASAGNYVSTVNIVGGTLYNSVNNLQLYTTQLVLTGGTVSQAAGQYDFTNGYGVTTNASTATSLFSGSIGMRDSNIMPFTVASGTAPGGVDLLVSGQISGGSGITKSGSGLMELTNITNNYGGATTISGGTLQVGDGATTNGKLPGSVVDNATLVFANPTAQAYSGSISGSGSLVKAAAGTLTLTSNLVSLASTTINGGNLAFSNGDPYAVSNSITINSPGALNVSGVFATTTVMGWFSTGEINPGSTGPLALTGLSTETISMSGYNTLSLGAVAGGATFSGSLTPAGATYYLGGGGGALTYTPAITGSYGLAVGSGGTVILTAGNSYTGPTTIASGGTLQFGSAANQALSSNVSGGGALVMAGPGLLTLSGNNNYAGGTSVIGGTLEATTTASLPGYNTASAVSVAGGTVPGNAGYYFLSGGGVLAVQTSGGATAGWNSTQIGSLLTNTTWGNQTAALGIDTTNGNFTYGGAINQAVSLDKLGGNTLTLTAANSYTGNTIVSGGTLTFTNVNTFGGINAGGIPLGIVSIHQGALNVASGGVLTNTSEIDVGDTAGQTGTLTLNSGTAAVSSGNNFWSGVNVGYNGGTGVVTLSGNSLLDITPTNAFYNVLDIGFDSNGFTGSAGTVTVGGNATVRALGTTKGSPATYIAVGDGGTGNLTIANSGLVETALFMLGSTAQSGDNGGVGTLRLNGGTLSVPQIQNNVGATGNIYFNSGVLQASASSSDFLQSSGGGTLNAYVQAGGAMIDSNGNDITLNLPLLHDPALGSTPDGGLTKLGAGSLILATTDSYTGNTDVVGGTLEVLTSNSLPYGSGLTVGTNGTVEIGAPSGAVGSMVATSVHVASPAGDVAAVPEPGTLALLGVAGILAAVAAWRRRKGICS